MSLENEFYHYKKMIDNDKAKLAKMESVEIVEDETDNFTLEERLQAKQDLIDSLKKNIKENTKFLNEIIDELNEFIKSGGEVSNMTLDALDFNKNASDDKEWTYDDLYAFKNKVLNYKEDYMGEKIGNHVFGGAGNKCIKLNGSVPENTVFISYEDVLDEKTKTAKEVYNYFFKDDSTTENIPVETIDRITGDFEDEIKEILIEKGLMTEKDYLFTISELGAWTDKNKMINHINNSYDLILFDTKYLYLIRKSEMDNNYEVEDVKYNSRYKELIKEVI